MVMPRSETIINKYWYIPITLCYWSYLIRSLETVRFVLDYRTIQYWLTYRILRYRINHSLSPTSSARHWLTWSRFMMFAKLLWVEDDPSYHISSSSALHQIIATIRALVRINWNNDVSNSSKFSTSHCHRSFGNLSTYLRKSVCGGLKHVIPLRGKIGRVSLRFILTPWFRTNLRSCWHDNLSAVWDKGVSSKRPLTTMTDVIMAGNNLEYWLPWSSESVCRAPQGTALLGSWSLNRHHRSPSKVSWWARQTIDQLW